MSRYTYGFTLDDLYSKKAEVDKLIEEEKKKGEDTDTYRMARLLEQKALSYSADFLNTRFRLPW